MIEVGKYYFFYSDYTAISIYVKNITNDIVQILECNRLNELVNHVKISKETSWGYTNVHKNLIKLSLLINHKRKVYNVNNELVFFGLFPAPDFIIEHLNTKSGFGTNFDYLFNDKSYMNLIEDCPFLYVDTSGEHYVVYPKVSNFRTSKFNKILNDFS